MSNSLLPHGLQHPRLPCPSLTPRVILCWLFVCSFRFGFGVACMRFLFSRVTLGKFDCGGKKKSCPLWGSNSGPSDYETDALPTALRRQTRCTWPVWTPSFQSVESAGCSIMTYVIMDCGIPTLPSWFSFKMWKRNDTLFYFLCTLPKGYSEMHFWRLACPELSSCRFDLAVASP